MNSSWKNLCFIASSSIIFFSPVLFFNKVFFDGDSLTLMYPYAAFFQHHIGTIWNKYILSGFPINSSTTSFGFSNLFNLNLFRYFNFVLSYNLTIALMFVAGGMCMYWFARELKLEHKAALLTAIVYMFNQWNTHWVSNIVLAVAMFVLPAVFLSIRKIFNNQFLYLILVVGSVGMGFVSAHPQFIVLILLAAGAYALYLCWQKHQEGHLGEGVRSLALVGGGVFGGLALGFQQVLNSSLFASLSTRNQGLSYGQAIDTSAASLIDFIKYILPHVTLRSLTAQEFLPYVGILPLFFGLTAIVLLWKTNKEVRFFTVLVTTALLISIKYSPLLWIMLKLPVLQYFRGPSRWLFTGNFAFAVLAGFGFEWLMTHPLSQVHKKITNMARWITVLVGSIALAVNAAYLIFGKKIIFLAQQFFDKKLYVKTTHLPINYYHQVIVSIIQNSFSNISIMDIQFIVAFVSLAASWCWLRYFSQHKNREILAIGLITLNLIMVGWLDIPFGSNKILIQEPPMATFIKTREKTAVNFRIMSFLIGMASSEKITAIYPNSVYDGIEYVYAGLIVNSNLLWDIPSVDGRDTIANRRGQKLFAQIGSENAESSGALSAQEIPIEQKVNKFAKLLPLLSMLNVKYIVSAYQLPPTPHLSLIHTASVTRFNIPMYLYENASVLPRVYLANSITNIPSDDTSAFAAITNPTNDFSKTTYLECSGCQANTVSKKDTLSILSYTDGFLDTKVTTELGRWLVFSESNLPGWQITIDNQPVKATTANYLFQAVYVPKGEHGVKFEYKGI